jgi:hypothetical protein
MVESSFVLAPFNILLMTRLLSSCQKFSNLEPDENHCYMLPVTGLRRENVTVVFLEKQPVKKLPENTHIHRLINHAENIQLQCPAEDVLVRLACQYDTRQQRVVYADNPDCCKAVGHLGVHINDGGVDTPMPKDAQKIVGTLSHKQIYASRLKYAAQRLRPSPVSRAGEDVHFIKLWAVYGHKDTIPLESSKSCATPSIGLGHCCKCLLQVNLPNDGTPKPGLAKLQVDGCTLPAWQ